MSADIVPLSGSTSLTAMTEQELIEVLGSSLYPGAQLKSIKMVIVYCKAAGLDPMQKPCHIVPMWDKTAKAMRDVIMPGVGLYRTQAARSGALAGIGEPEFGAIETIDLDGEKFSVPSSCRVVVKRLLSNGAIGEFSAIEYWIENYANAGKDASGKVSMKPNAMWRKRPRGQLAKCAQAQALRMAFPEMTGSAPTADEMEGKSFEASEIDITPQKQEPPIEKVFYSADNFKKNADAWRATIESGKKTHDSLIAMIEQRAPLTDAQKTVIREWQPKPQPKTDTSEFDAGLDADYTPE